ncbi:MAG TPA: hypothetical protein VLB44_20310 [Kofleriaceae bacterium]|nr:hypothetical protein [Kofleriaceae bacterium]
MSFEEIAQRMKDQRGMTRPERLHMLWTGEEPELPPVPTPVEPARRTATLVAAYLLLALGLLVVMAGGIVLLAWYRETQGMHRVLLLVVGIGISIIVASTKMFERAAATAPLPDARLRE